MFTTASNPYEFDKHGINGITAISETTIRDEVYASYDLTILKTKDGYQFAHGCVVDASISDTETEAQSKALAWYENNRQAKAITA
jgi:hypothetical protein